MSRLLIKSPFYVIFIFLLVSCNSKQDKKEKILKEIDVLTSFSISTDNFKIKNLKTDKLIVKNDLENKVEELIIYKGSSIKNFVSSDNVLIREKGIYIIITDSEIKIYNTNNNEESVFLYKMLRHYFEVNRLFNGEVLAIYTSDSCTSSGIDKEGREQSKTYKFDHILEENINQILTETSTHFYIYKLDLKSNPEIYTEFEPIYSLEKSNWNSFSDNPIEKVFLDDKMEYIERKETDFIDHKQTLTDAKFEWEANNKRQSYTITKVDLLNRIRDEL